MSEDKLMYKCEYCHELQYLSEFSNEMDICLTCQMNKLTIQEGYKHVLSIDIGIKHLALTLVVLDDNFNFNELLFTKLIDITVFDCLPNCKLYHTKTFTDWISHLSLKYKDFFDKADVILIERQPPTGLVAVEQLLFSMFRHKSVLISPTSVHKFFKINIYDYDTRKEHSIKIASKYISLEEFDRKHDVSDTVLFIVFWGCKMREDKKKREVLEKKDNIIKKYNKNLGMTIEEFFKSYRYSKK